ncbi:hypothetical protein ES707_18786 [subsurface metagenome]
MVSGTNDLTRLDGDFLPVREDAVTRRNNQKSVIAVRTGDALDCTAATASARASGISICLRIISHRGS